ncbi:hypothetical protein FIBSPDRAFT_892611 [Athelia psychrophila]|uniref:Uncharacterized protein n=1 Tax=Athelia psychrophila TaxID=1759441 RepID=A0A166IC70_9AGAM|nr:hypothetical protein FIBSPDRAFT_892611 [Fibularhizoctonia sp. CBS 109695]
MELNAGKMVQQDSSTPHAEVYNELGVMQEGGEVFILESFPIGHLINDLLDLSGIDILQVVARGGTGQGLRIERIIELGVFMDSAKLAKAVVFSGTQSLLWKSQRRLRDFYDINMLMDKMCVYLYKNNDQPVHAKTEEEILMHTLHPLIEAAELDEQEPLPDKPKTSKGMGKSTELDRQKSSPSSLPTPSISLFKSGPGNPAMGWAGTFTLVAGLATE